MTEDKKQQKPKTRTEAEPVIDEDEEFEDEHLFEDAEFEAEGWSIPHDPESVAKLLKSLEGLVPGILRRAGAESSSSWGSKSSSAKSSDSAGDGFRARLGGTKLPRELVNFILAQVDTTKREFLRIASNEVRLFLESVDLGGEVAKILTSLSFEVRMEVRFIPNDQAVKPSARGRVRVKRNRSADDKGAENNEEEGASADAPSGDEEIPGRELSDVFNPRRWSLRRRPRAEEGFDEEPSPDSESQLDDEPGA